MKSDEEIKLQNCWKESGIYGDASCIKLKEHIHCKKCPVYYATGKELFDRQIPDNYRDEWARIYSGKKETELTDTIFAVIFRLRSEWFGLITVHVQEFTENRPVHSVPYRSSDTFLGLVNIDGELIPCMSLINIIGLSHDTESDSKNKSLKPMIVLNIEGERFVFSVDEIMGIHMIPVKKMKKPPSTVSKK